MEGDLEVVAPVASLVAVGGQDRIVEEYLEAVEVGAEPVQDDDIGRDDEEVARKRGVGFVELVEEAPSDEEGEDFGFAGTGGHFHDVARPILGEHAAGHGAGGIEPDQVVFVAGTPDLEKPDHRLDRFALGEVVAESGKRAIGVLGEVFGVEPVAEQGGGGGGRPGVAFGAPGEHFLANLRDERREEFFVGRTAEGFVGGKPALLGNQRRVWRMWKLRM